MDGCSFFVFVKQKNYLFPVQYGLRTYPPTVPVSYQTVPHRFFLRWPFLAENVKWPLQTDPVTFQVHFDRDRPSPWPWPSQSMWLWPFLFIFVSRSPWWTITVTVMDGYHNGHGRNGNLNGTGTVCQSHVTFSAKNERFNVLVKREPYHDSI